MLDRGDEAEAKYRSLLLRPVGTKLTVGEPVAEQVLEQTVLISLMKWLANG